MKQINMMPHRGFPFFFQRQENLMDLAHDDQLEVGDMLFIEKWNGALGRTIRIGYAITEIVESRPSKGNWKPLDFIPTWFRVKVGDPVALN